MDGYAWSTLVAWERQERAAAEAHQDDGDLAAEWDEPDAESLTFSDTDALMFELDAVLAAESVAS